MMDRMSGRTVCESFLSVMELYAQMSRAEDEALMKSKFSSSILESLWWKLETGNPEWDVSVAMILYRFGDSVEKSAEPKFVLIDFSVAIQSILEHYKGKNLSPRHQRDMYKRLESGKFTIEMVGMTRQRDLDNERVKKQRLAEERAQIIDSQARRASLEAKKALAAMKPEGMP